jgi:hypothetical protein
MQKSKEFLDTLSSRIAAPSGSAFDVVAGTLDLINKILHVGREPAGQEHVDIELLTGRILLSLVEPGLKILQALRALRNHLMVHGTFRAFPT